MRSGLAAVLVGVAVVMIGSACGQSTTATTEHGAPMVEQPLDANVRSRPPCTLLPDSQLTAAGLPATAEHRTVYDAAADACLWGIPNRKSSQTVTVAWSHDTLSLDALYAARGLQKYFEETTVLGYPAVFASTIREDTHCVVTVGVNDTTVFYVAVQWLDPDDEACTIARQVATEVVRALQQE